MISYIRTSAELNPYFVTSLAIGMADRLGPVPCGLVGPFYFYAERLDLDEKDAVLMDTLARSAARTAFRAVGAQRRRDSHGSLSCSFDPLDPSDAATRHDHGDSDPCIATSALNIRGGITAGTATSSLGATESVTTRSGTGRRWRRYQHSSRGGGVTPPHKQNLLDQAGIPKMHP
jgi:hypothetical protein